LKSYTHTGQKQGVKECVLSVLRATYGKKQSIGVLTVMGNSIGLHAPRSYFQMRKIILFVWSENFWF